MTVLHAALHALVMAGTMAWEILWALILGFGLSAVVQAVVSALALQPFDGAELPFAFLAAFGNKETTIKRLRKGDSNASDDRLEESAPLQERTDKLKQPQRASRRVKNAATLPITSISLRYLQRLSSRCGDRL